ncbi:MAG TPA: sigma factor, partial [Gaiellaceae bacterium]|nr:sigma factor [Gaiellaceae bacterium]
MVVRDRAAKPPFEDDATLVAALRARDEAAFGYLLDRYDGALRRLARTYVSTAHSADEVVQDTWLAVVKGIDAFEGRSSVSTWIYRILANIARSRGVREHRSVPFSSAPG